MSQDALPGDLVEARYDGVYTCVRVLSAAPLVTISTTHSTCPAGAASFASDIFGDRPALHLLHPSWTVDTDLAGDINRATQSLGDINPVATFVLLASDSDELRAFAQAGGEAVLGSGLIMTDERKWYPRPVAPGARRFEALYDARLDTWKRHELARDIESLLLVYTPAYDTPMAEALPRARQLLPRAVFANHDLHGGTYRRFDHDELPNLYAQASVGLCLSALEGCMRVSMQYLLCGMPLVSTRSVGGRDRYFGTSYCRVVAHDDPAEVAHATRTLASLDLDRQRIREHIGQVLAFERYNLLLDINRIARRHFAIDYDVLKDFSPFLGSVSKFTSGRRARAIIRDALEHTSGPTAS